MENIAHFTGEHSALIQNAFSGERSSGAHWKGSLAILKNQESGLFCFLEGCSFWLALPILPIIHSSPLAITNLISVYTLLGFFVVIDFPYNWEHTIFILLQLISPKAKPSSTIPVIANHGISFFYSWIAFHCIYSMSSNNVGYTFDEMLYELDSGLYHLNFGKFGFVKHCFTIGHRTYWKCKLTTSFIQSCVAKERIWEMQY